MTESHEYELLTPVEKDLLRRVKQVYVECGDLVGTPYRFAGGHNSLWLPSLSYADGIGAPGAGVDCSSGSSIALRAGGLCSNPRPPFPLSSGNFMGYGKPGAGRWLTVHANTHHMGLEFTIPRSLDPTGFYQNQWFQAANPTAGVGWITLDTTGMVSRHWPGC